MLFVCRFARSRPRGEEPRVGNFQLPSAVPCCGVGTGHRQRSQRFPVCTDTKLFPMKLQKLRSTNPSLILSTGAPFFIKISAHSKFPAHTAASKAVIPSGVVMFTSAPFSTKISVTSSRPENAAWWSENSPNLAPRFTFTPSTLTSFKISSMLFSSTAECSNISGISETARFSCLCKWMFSFRASENVLLGFPLGEQGDKGKE